MPASPGTEEVAPPTLTLKERLVAWWEGYDLSGLMQRRRDAAADGPDAAAGGVSSGPAEGKHLNRKGKPLWTATRVQVSEKIWGEGFSTPGGTDFIPSMVKPLGLNPAMSVLDIGAGLGGATRTMAQQYGAWVTGLEHNPVLAELGMFRSQKSGLARQAPVQQMDLDGFKWTKRVDAIFSKEALFTIRNKEGLIDGIEAALKPRGQLLFTDYVVDPAALKQREFDSWANHEPAEPHPWTVEQYATALTQRNLDIRITEDNSDIHRSTILAAIQSLVKHLETVSMDRDTKIAVVEEVELWARRVAALNAGLRVYRFYAMKPADVG
ncbi:methyltransferase domain-containing protein [Aerophototrophica crusticola]|uniref:Methyltransferase domain-containing protein n=1 Tax=Aerophototrophica crusticola TaxID=1709002 RepID=A0A858R3A7_9PROT|nr:methyltransferase domain-containing protein [Rhodospirillaceae bacterium B3]